MFTHCHKWGCKVLQELCGMEVSSSQVSDLIARLDPELKQWRERPLSPVSHIILDATYLKVRVDSCVRSCAVLIAVGCCRQSGKRIVLGVSAALSEAEVHWRAFLSSLKQRGCGVPDSITSDAHEGIKSAVTCVFPGVKWQRCQFHLQQNAQAYVPKAEMKVKVAADIRRIFNAPDRHASQTLLEEIATQYEKTAPRLSSWMLENIPEGLTLQDFPEPIRKKLRTSNMMENINRQIKRRTKVACLFPNTDSILRLVSAILQEISNEWESGRSYLSL
ncbi:MAG: IS256 family transposase [Akkermansia sp.]